MIDLNRRSFLKGAAILSSGLIINDFSLLFPKEVMFIGQEEFGNFRAMIQYDIETDTDFIRYDIGTKIDQFHVTCSVPTAKQGKVFKNQCHHPMAAVLKNEIRHRNIKKRDLISLPYPPGYKHPDWFQKIWDKGGI